MGVQKETVIVVRVVTAGSGLAYLERRRGNREEGRALFENVKEGPESGRVGMAEAEMPEDGMDDTE